MYQSVHSISLSLVLLNNIVLWLLCILRYYEARNYRQKTLGILSLYSLMLHSYV